MKIVASEETTYLRFPVVGKFADVLREFAQVEGIDFETPYMAYFDKRFGSVEEIRKNWMTMQFQGVYAIDICDRQMLVAAISQPDQEVHTRDYGDLPFVVLMELPAMHSIGLGLINQLRDLLMENPLLQFYVPA